jgi:hypothetical protein
MRSVLSIAACFVVFAFAITAGAEALIARNQRVMDRECSEVHATPIKTGSLRYLCVSGDGRIVKSGRL